MKINDAGLKIIKDSEGLRLKAYLCPAGVYTIGYGHTKNVKYGDVITATTAETLLKQDVEKYEKLVDAINAKGNYNFNENEFSALVSFAFNIGNVNGVTANATRTKEQIGNAMLLYCCATVNGKKKKLSGLETRRKKEYALFKTAVKSTTNVSRETNTEQESYNMKLIKKGSKGTAVKIWQCIIGVTPDGNFGTTTEKVTKTFQKNHGLIVDGKVGDMTWDAGFSTIS